MDKLREDMEIVVKIQEETINKTWFADDIAILAENEQDIKSIRRKCMKSLLITTTWELINWSNYLRTRARFINKLWHIGGCEEICLGNRIT